MTIDTQPGNIPPRYRDDLDFQPVDLEGDSFILVNDPLQIQEEPMVLSQGAFMILQLLDGERSVENILDILRQQYRAVGVEISQILEVIQTFRQSHLLEDERYLAFVEEMIQRFEDAPTRLPFHAGVSYPEDKEELTRWVDSLLEQVDPPTVEADSLVAVVAPHLDLRVESKSYALTYKALQGLDVERVIILGTGHQLRQGMFSLTNKDYETPLGTMPCDTEAVAVLREAAGALLDDRDFAHSREHSIEFQIPFLQRVLQNPETPIVPVLCGSMSAHLEDCQVPTDIEGVEPFLKALSSLLTPKTLVVAAVDFCHVGLKFGHPYTGEMMENAARAHDANLLKALEVGSLDALWKESRRVMDFYNVCGFSSMSCLLGALPDIKGHVARYGVWHEAETGSAVSFASILFQGAEAAA